MYTGTTHTPHMNVLCAAFHKYLSTIDKYYFVCLFIYSVFIVATVCYSAIIIVFWSYLLYYFYSGQTVSVRL